MENIHADAQRGYGIRARPPQEQGPVGSGKVTILGDLQVIERDVRWLSACEPIAFVPCGLVCLERFPLDLP